MWRGCGWRWRGPLPTFGRRPVRWLRPTNPWRPCEGWQRAWRPARVGAPGGRELRDVVWREPFARGRRPGPRLEARPWSVWRGCSLFSGSFRSEGGHGYLRGVEQLRAVATIENLETDALSNA